MGIDVLRFRCSAADSTDSVNHCPSGTWSACANCEKTFHHFSADGGAGCPLNSSSAPCFESCHQPTDFAPVNQSWAEGLQFQDNAIAATPLRRQREGDRSRSTSGVSADFNLDGHKDFVTFTGRTDIELYTNDGMGGFVASYIAQNQSAFGPDDTNTGAGPIRGVVADFNGDSGKYRTVINFHCLLFSLPFSV